MLSMAQLFLDAFRLGKGWSGVAGNPIKLWLGFASLLLDFGFLYQHFVLYAHGNALDEYVEVASSSFRSGASVHEDEDDGPVHHHQGDKFD